MNIISSFVVTANVLWMRSRVTILKAFVGLNTVYANIAIAIPIYGG